MKRRRRTRLPAITAEQARMALNILMTDGRIAAREVARALARREKLVRELRRRLAALGESAAGAVARAARKRPLPKLTPRRRRAVRRRARKAITRAQRVARQAQGRYLGAIRGLSETSRAKVREIRKSSGVKAAIAAAKKLAS
ncbi:MAG: hypothetical protein ACRD3M_11030 [Thermoanaerobaculia bacterium]